MTKMRFSALIFLAFTLALPVFGKTYKNSYSVPCGQVWTGVKATLANADNYTVDEMDDAQMKATYDVKHQAHVNVSGALLQRKNKVSLLPKGSGCEMDVVSNYSGWEHNDQGDFKQRVDEAMANMNATPPAANQRSR
jgi:hypothetical protein